MLKKDHPNINQLQTIYFMFLLATFLGIVHTYVEMLFF